MPRIKFLLLIFIANIVIAAKDCPGDMVLWRQPGSNDSDCICPTGQSMVTNMYDINLHTFGKCSDSYIPVSKTWPVDVSGNIICWIDADNPYGNGYRSLHGKSFTTLRDNASTRSFTSGTGAIYNANNSDYNFILSNNSFTPPSMYSFFFSPTNLTIFLVVNYSSNPSGSYNILRFNNGGPGNVSININTSNISFAANNCGPTGIISPNNTTIGANQIIVAKYYIDSANLRLSLSIALINKDTGYNNIYNSANSYVISGTGSCTYNNFILGTNLASSYVGNLKEFIVYNANLSDSQITQILAILNQKWQVF